MAIIISENGKNAERLEESNFALENNLQQYIYDNPDAIPLYDIDQDTRLFIAAREFATNSGPIDALGFDAKGNIYVVETKLYKNPDKRTVVAQALDYGASLWKHSMGEDFILRLNSHCQKQFGQSFADKYAEFFSPEETSDAITTILDNLADGSIKFVVLMDKLHDALKDLVVFVNQNSKFDLYAVELEYYRHKSYEIIIPKLYGAEVKKEVASTKPEQKYMTPSTKEAFIKYLNEHCNQGEITVAAKKAVLVLHDLYTKLATDTGGSITYTRAITPYRDVIKLVVHDSSNKVPLFLDSDSSIGAYPSNKSGKILTFLELLLQEMIKQNMLKRTGSHLNAMQWFINLKKSYATDVQIEQFVALNEKVLQAVLK